MNQKGISINISELVFEGSITSFYLTHELSYKLNMLKRGIYSCNNEIFKITKKLLRGAIYEIVASILFLYQSNIYNTATHKIN